MARYWVGGTATWDATVGTKWATTSGGAGGASVPTSSDDVYFDASSGAVTCSTSASSTCKNLTCTGFTGTLQGSLLYIYGSLTFVSTMNVPSQLFLCGTSSYTLTTANKFFSCYVQGSGGTYTLQDNWVGHQMWVSAGTFDANDKNISLYTFYLQNTATTLLGNGTWTMDYNVSGATLWSVDSGTTLTCESSTVQFPLHAGTTTIFQGGGKTYNKLRFYLAAGTGTIKGSNTISELIIDRSSASIAINFETGKTNTITTFTAAVSSTRTVTLRSTTTTNSTIAKAGGGTVQAYYMDVDYITGSGATTWYMGNSLTSVDGGHNSQIYFTSPALTNPANAYTDDASYATGASDTGNMYIELSKDGGATWTSSLYKTAIAGEASYTYGAGSTELWGTAFTGDDVDDTSFRLRIKGAFFQEIYKTFGFAITASLVLSGVEIVVKAKWDGTTTSINHIKVKIYYTDSSSPITAGSQAFASNGRKNGEGAGTGTGVLVFYDGTAWRACDTGATVQS